MGLLELLVLPVWAPLRGIIWIGEKVAEQADHELEDETDLREQLTLLELRYDLEEISEEEYLAAEEALLARIEAVRERLEAAQREE